MPMNQTMADILIATQHDLGYYVAGAMTPGAQGI